MIYKKNARQSKFSYNKKKMRGIQNNNNNIDFLLRIFIIFFLLRRMFGVNFETKNLADASLGKKVR